MKTLMLGNEAAARGLFEAGCSFVSSYPGTPSTEITECAAKYPEIYAEWAPNEKVAMEAAFGASLSGRRSFCGMKHVGLNVAADPLFTLSYTGVRGGMVIGVADDAGMHSSQNEQDSRHYAIAAKLPMLEPSDAAESLAFAKLAYELSEKFDTPVLLKMCTRVAHAQSVVETSERQEVAPIPYEKDIAKFVMMPACAKARHPIVEQRTLALQAWAETADVNRVEDGADHSIKIENLLIDTGFNAETAAKLFAPGDIVTFAAKPAQLQNGRLAGPALDDRIGCVAVLAAAEEIAAEKPDCRVTVMLSSMEEVGGQGAGTGGFAVMPDYAIAVDVSFGDGFGCAPEKTAPLGGGTMLGYAPILDREFTLKLKKLAETHEIPVQHEPMGGRTGTDADELAIAGQGVRTALLSIPLRSMHTVAETIDPEDVVNTARLMALAAKEGI